MTQRHYLRGLKLGDIPANVQFTFITLTKTKIKASQTVHVLFLFVLGHSFFTFGFFVRCIFLQTRLLSF
jgi:hypothetical protein